ncbi:hypothetical protein [Photobacterium sanguinicancri]|uniref:Uncharacterized protein n=1 Tax=Photobacterium sanguinicancri TaxID=875932 RepID=A0AAW7Y2J2_9GAMM|nr:hypothetical protein [Photobacterium sanguinicancri]MDO6498878.1 hypothetical protein [Photobacterium sanguinicancri]MDO6542619.1 hypothetical protein [Photobacterium sanguinicancri]
MEFGALGEFIVAHLIAGVKLLKGGSMSLEKTKELKVVSTNVDETCSHGCQLPYNGEMFESNVNHYIKEHGYKLLHIGQESSTDSDGNPYHSTVAVLAVK